VIAIISLFEKGLPFAKTYWSHRCAQGICGSIIKSLKYGGFPNDGFVNRFFSSGHRLTLLLHN
jgi:hypothetical protein